MTRVHFAIPGDLATLTGGYGYDRRVLAQLPAHGVNAIHLPLSDDFPFPSPSAVDASLRALGSVSASDVLLVDGLALGALPPDGIGALQAPVVALVHHPLGLESGLDARMSEALVANERAVLAHAREVIVTSDTTRTTLVAHFGVPAPRITVAEPGTDPAPRAHGSGGPLVHILAVGSITPRKGHAVLIEALAGLLELRWRLTIVGSPDRDPPCAGEVRRAIAQHGLGDRVTLAGECEEHVLAQVYDGADLFVLPSLYEGYGMVLAEAMAHGLPIVTTTGGAAAATVPDEAALKVPPGDALALRDALARVLRDEPLRRQLAEASWGAGQDLPRWSDTAASIARVLKKVGGVP